MTYFDIKGSYYGGKSGAGVYQQIINQIPPHEVFVSGCLGYCGIMRNKRPANFNYGYDMDSDIIDMWNSLVKPRGSLWHFSKGDILDKLESNEAAEDVDYFTEHYFWRSHVFLYLDPPYLLESRLDSRTRYKCEFLPMDHQRLFAAVRNLHCMVAISHYPTPLYNQLLEEGWRYIDFQATTRRGVATERLYMNYPEPAELHDYNYLGDDYKERERIKLKFERWKNNYKELPPLEQAMRAQWLAR